MDLKLESKLRRLTRMSFQDIYANAYSSPEVWKAAGKTDFKVWDWTFFLGESNGGTLQLLCVGVETFGRVLLGHSNKRGVASQAFPQFIELFFPPAYKAKANEIYCCYRCGLLHSHYLGFGSTKEGFYPTRGLRLLSDKHLEYANLAGDAALPQKDNNCFRLIINIDVFLNDFAGAVEKYLESIVKSEKFTASNGVLLDVSVNAQKALKDLPLEDADLLAVQKASSNSQLFGDATLIATQISYPILNKSDPKI